MNKPEIIHLTIFRRGDILILDLGDRKTISPKSEIKVEKEFLDSLQSKINQLANLYNKWSEKTPDATKVKDRPQDSILTELKNLGSVLYDQLLSEPVKERLTASPPTSLFLKIDESLISIPWELIFDGTYFLCNKFCIGRQIATGARDKTTSSNREFSLPLKMLIISDPTENLKGAQIECEALLNEFSNLPDIELTMRGGKRVDKLWLLGNISKFDIVHYAGHAFYSEDEPEKSGWQISGDNITAGEISKISNPPFLVFSNACQSGKGTIGLGRYHYEGEAFGLGSGFLLSGVQNYIGPFWVIHDEPSVKFALTFYHSLLKGATLGESLQASRHNVIEQFGWNELLWASYILYGDPEFRLVENEGFERGEVFPSSPPLLAPKREGDTSQEIPLTSRHAKIENAKKSRKIKTKGIFIILLCIALIACGAYLGTKVLKGKPFGSSLFPFGTHPHILIDITEKIDGIPSEKNIVKGILEDTLSSLTQKHRVRLAITGTAETSFLREDNLSGTIFYIYTTDLNLKVIDRTTGRAITTKNVHVNKGAQNKGTAATISLKSAGEEVSHSLITEINARQRGGK